MVPITSSEILFLGGWRDSRYLGEVSVLNLATLKRRVLINGQNYSFVSMSNTFNISKTGEVTTIVKKSDGQKREIDLIRYSRMTNTLKVVKEGLKLIDVYLQTSLR